MQKTYDAVRRRLEELGDPAARESAQRFFKESVKAYGVTAAGVKSLARECIRETKKSPKEELFALCEMLWESGYIEEGGLAAELAYSRRKSFTPEDFALFVAWIDKHISNWAACDALCTRVMGPLIEMYPELAEKLRGMTASPNRWMRRAAAVSLINPARRGLFLEDVFALADALLADADDMTQKGYGWLLKSASNAHPEEVFAYVTRNKEKMPRTALRYAIEKLPPDQRRQIMQK